MNIIKRELKANLKALIIWSLSLTFVYFSASTEYSAFRDNPEILDAMGQFEDMFRAMGISTTDMTTPQGFLSMMSIYLYLPISIYGALLGSSIISKEERDRTAEYLFTLPITREKVLLNKIIGAFILLLLLVIYLLGMLTVIFYRFGLSSDFYNFILYLLFALPATGYIFMSIGMLMASVLKQYKKSGSAVLAILISTYMLNILIGLTDKIDFLQYFVPFQYYKVEDMLEGNIELKFVLLTIFVIGSCITGVFVFYKKRDLYI